MLIGVEVASDPKRPLEVEIDLQELAEKQRQLCAVVDDLVVKKVKVVVCVVRGRVNDRGP